MPEYVEGASPILLLEWWKPVPGWEDLYEVSNIGNIRSLKTQRLRSAYPNKKGYMIIKLYRDTKAHAYQVHPFVAHCFVGPRPQGLLVNHKNAWKLKNWASNLEYMTSLENTRHAIEAGVYKPGTYHSKLDDHDVVSIRELLNIGLYTTEIASLYHVHNSAISRIKNGKFKTRPREPILGHGQRGERHHEAKLTEADVLEIRSLRPAVTLVELAARFGVSTTNISDAANGKTWKHPPGARPVGEARPGPRSSAPANPK